MKTANNETNDFINKDENERMMNEKQKQFTMKVPQLKHATRYGSRYFRSFLYTEEHYDRVRVSATFCSVLVGN